MSSYKSNPLSRYDIRGMTKRIRKSINISDDCAFPVIEFLEVCYSGVQENEYSLDICSTSEMGDNYALAVPSKKELKIREDVYNDAINNVPRHRFTIAHEIGHTFLHDNNTIAFARGDEEVLPYENPEWQANVFAAELLAPADAIKGMSVEEVMKKYKCSRQVAEIQLEHSERIWKKLPNSLKVW